MKTLVSSRGDAEKSIMTKLNSLIDNHLNQASLKTDCFPKDWLPMDLDENDLDSVRILGCNYDTLYTLWGEDLIDDKK